MDTLEISNFRGFKYLKATNLARVNLLVGDNGAGKTAFLEAFYLLVSGHSDKPLALKTWRGMNIAFRSNSRESLVDEVYGDLFHDLESRESVSIVGTGRGFENRKLVISHEPDELIVPLTPNRKSRRAQQKIGKPDDAIAVPLSFRWTDEHSIERVAKVLMSAENVRFHGTEERLPVCHMFAAQIPVSAEEPANMFSDLVKSRKADEFKEVFLSVFDEIKDISVASQGNSATLWADVPWATRLLPLSVISGGTSRAAAILLAITVRRNGLVLIDEVESGIFHRRQKQFSRGLLKLSEDYNTQLIMTTHSEEWIASFLDCVTDEDDVAFWRLERGPDRRPNLSRFTVPQFRAGMTIGDMR